MGRKVQPSGGGGRTVIKMQLLLMEAHDQETQVQAPVLLRCVVAADMQVILRGGLTIIDSLVLSLSFYSIWREREREKII